MSLEHINSKTCLHENFLSNVAVARIESDVLRFMADITIKCTSCETNFRFIGLPTGLDLNGACVSANGQEARLAIAPANQVYSILEDRCTGFTVRKEK